MLTVKDLRAALSALPDDLPVVAVDGLTVLAVWAPLGAAALCDDSRMSGCPEGEVAELARSLDGQTVYLPLSHFA